MAPEYAMHGQFSVKTDVFSFGVLVIEIVTGKRNNNGGSNGDEDAEDLLSWVSTVSKTKPVIGVSVLVILLIKFVILFFVFSGVEMLERRHYTKRDRSEFDRRIKKRDVEMHTHWSFMRSRKCSD